MNNPGRTQSHPYNATTLAEAERCFVLADPAVHRARLAIASATANALMILGRKALPEPSALIAALDVADGVESAGVELAAAEADARRRWREHLARGCD